MYKKIIFCFVLCLAVVVYAGEDHPVSGAGVRNGENIHNEPPRKRGKLLVMRPDNIQENRKMNAEEKREFLARLKEFIHPNNEKEIN